MLLAGAGEALLPHKALPVVSTGNQGFLYPIMKPSFSQRGGQLPETWFVAT